MKKIDFYSHNWLAYKINNRSLESKLHWIKGRVIDLGCGTAPYKESIENYSTDYIGVDWDNSLHHTDEVDLKADLTKSFPLKDANADTVVSFQVIEHLPEPASFFSECFRILKPGGHLFFTVPFMWHIHEDPYDYYRFTKFGLKYLLDSSGFIDILIQENTGFWQTWVLKFNYHSLRFAGGFLRYFWIPLWWLNQTIAPFLDKIDYNYKETASYSVIATKG